MQRRTGCGQLDAEAARFQLKGKAPVGNRLAVETDLLRFVGFDFKASNARLDDITLQGVDAFVQQGTQGLRDHAAGQLRQDQHVEQSTVEECLGMELMPAACLSSAADC